MACLANGGGVYNGCEVDEISLDSREEELGVLATGAGEETVLQERGLEPVQLVLETEQALLACNGGATLLDSVA